MSIEEVNARRKYARDRYRAGPSAEDALIKYVRRQVLATVDAYLSRQESWRDSIDELRFRLSTMRLLAPSGDPALDDARIASLAAGVEGAHQP